MGFPYYIGGRNNLKGCAALEKGTSFLAVVQGGFTFREVSREQSSLRKARKTELRLSPSRAAISSPVKRLCRSEKISLYVFPSACRDSAGAGAFVHKRFNAAMPITAFQFSDSTQAYTKSCGDSGGGILSNHFSSRPLDVSLEFLWLFTLFLVCLLVFVWEPQS